MSEYNWPPSLPQAPSREGYSESIGTLVVRTPMDAGPAKMRHRGRKPSVLSMSFVMDSIQVATLENFTSNVVRGVHRFGFTHPRTGADVMCRILGSDDGNFKLKRLSAQLWEVAINFEVMP